MAKSNLRTLPGPARARYVKNLEEGTERLTTELNATRLALAVMLDRAGRRALIGDSDIAAVQGYRIVSDKLDLDLGDAEARARHGAAAPTADQWEFKLVAERADA